MSWPRPCKSCRPEPGLGLASFPPDMDHRAPSDNNNGSIARAAGLRGAHGTAWSMQPMKNECLFGNYSPPGRSTSLAGSGIRGRDKGLIARSASPLRHREPGLAVAGFPSTLGDLFVKQLTPTTPTPDRRAKLQHAYRASTPAAGEGEGAEGRPWTTSYRLASTLPRRVPPLTNGRVSWAYHGGRRGGTVGTTTTTTTNIKMAAILSFRVVSMLQVNQFHLFTAFLHRHHGRHPPPL